MKTIRISEDLAKTAIEGLEWIAEDIDSFHLDGAEYDAEYDRLLAKEAAFDQAAATIKALLAAAK